MKLMLIVVITWIAILGASPSGAMEPDKVAHFASSAAYGAVADTLLYKFDGNVGTGGRVGIATGIGLVPGLIVEIVDWVAPENPFGWDDLLADGLGAVTGAVAAELINGQLWISASGRQVRLVGKW
jgi:putative lipoprotein